MEAEPVLLESATLLGHVAIVDGMGSGRITAALNLVEHALERGVPAILVDPTGEMSGYARPDWWQQSNDPERARQLAERIEVRLFTPGIRGGRPLSAAVIPDLSRVPETDHDREVRLAAGAIATMMRAAAGIDESRRLAMLTRAITVLAGRPSPAGLLELIALIESEDDELAGAAGDDAVRQSVVEDLVALLRNPDVFMPGAEPLTAATLVGPASDGRVPLAIVHTGILGDGARLRSWIAHMIGSVNRELASSTSGVLRTMVVLDDADLLLPAGVGKAPVNEPVQDLLKRAGAAGLGVVLASRRPGELDYRRCAPIDTWFIGKTDDLALDKMKPLFERHPLGHRNLSRLEPARFVMLRAGGAREVVRASPLIRIEPVAEAELKTLAARTRARPREASPVRRSDAGESGPSVRPQPPR
jgi:hypothetical protein